MHKPVLVTGASSGIGEATAVHLAHKGFTVFAAARRVKALNNLSALGGGRIHPIAMDVTDEHSIQDAMHAIANTVSTPLYGLINNAGVSVTGPLENVPIDEWKRLYETNVYGLIRVTQTVLPQMRAEKVGRIVNIGSVAGRIASPFFGPYASSKHAVEGLTDSLRRELANKGIKVSLIRPGFINTHFGDQEQESLKRFITPDGPYTDDVQAFAKWHERGHPNAVPPSQVAEAVHHALTAQNPSARYTVPKKYLGSVAVNDFLPTSLADKVLAKIVGMAKP